MEKLPRDRPITVNEGRVGCLHQNIFTRKVTDIAFTSDFCNNHSHPRPCVPAVLRLHPKRPRVPYLMSPSPSSRVLKSQTVSNTRDAMSSPLLVPARPSFIHGHDFRHFTGSCTKLCVFVDMNRETLLSTKPKPYNISVRTKNFKSTVPAVFTRQHTNLFIF